MQGGYADLEIFWVVDEPENLNNQVAAAALQRVGTTPAINVKWAQNGKNSTS